MLLLYALPVVLLAVAGIGAVVMVLSKVQSQIDAERVQVGQLAFRPCPPPTTCTGAITVMGEQRAFCTAPPSASIPPYANGDAVFIRDGKITAFAHITSANKNGTFQAERLSGYKLQVSAKDVFGRACRP